MKTNEETEDMEEYDMTQGNIDASSAGTYALLLDTLRAGRGSGGGYGYGGGEGGYGGYGLHAGNSVLAARAHADGTAIKEAIDKNGIIAIQGMDGIKQSFEDGTRTQQFFELSREHTDLERRVNDQNAALVGTLNDLRSDFKDCCCETQKLIIAEGTRTRELMLTTELQNAKDSNNITATVNGINNAAALNTAAIIAAIQNGGGHGGH